MAMSYDPFAPGVLANPYPWYRWLRSEAPCHYGDVVRIRNPIARGVHRLPVVVEPR